MDEQEIRERLNQIYFSEDCYEAETLRYLPLLLHPGDFFVDVGSSFGQYVLHAKKWIGNGRILAFEVDPFRYKELCRNVEEWSQGWGGEIQCVESAVAATPGTIEFHVTGTIVSGSLLRLDFEDRVKEFGIAPEKLQVKKLRVPATTLDIACADRVPTLVKIDVEGAELDILKGAQSLLAQGKTKFLIEVDERGDPAGIYALMKKHGYRHMPFLNNTLFCGPKQRSTWLRLRLRLIHFSLHPVREAKIWINRFLRRR